MFLPNFDLAQIIQAFNQREEKNINVNESFGCPYLELSLLTDCSHLIDAINDSTELFYFSDEENALLQQRGIKLKTWRNTTKNSNDRIREIFNGFKQAYELPQELIAKRNLFDWRKHYHTTLSHKENWINFIDRQIPLSELHQLKAEWKRREVFALHSTRCLSMMALQWLPNLITYHQQALTDLKWHYFSIPHTIYLAYRRYLKKFLQQAQQLQYQLADAMVDRLHIFIDSQLTHADVVVYTANKLRMECPTPSEQLTARQFVQFSHYIQTYGHTYTQQRWNALACFKDASFPLQTIGTEKIKLIVPKLLASAVPHQLKKPAWLFKGANLRYGLCENHVLDFVALQQLPEVTHVDVDIHAIESLAKTLGLLQSKQQLVDQLLDEIQKPPYSDLSIWHWRTHRFLKNYQSLLYDYQHQTMAAQLSIAEKLAAHLLHQDDTVEQALKMPFAANQTLSSLLQNLAATLETHPSLLFKQRLQSLRVNCQKPLALNRVAHWLKLAAEGQMIGEDNLHYIKTVLENTETYTHPVWQQFIYPFPKLFLKNVLTELKQNPMTMSHPHQQQNHYAQIHQAFNILQLLLPQYDAYAMMKPLKQYFLFYLHAILQGGNENKAFVANEAQLALFENVMDLFPKTHEIFIGHLSLAQCLGNLKNLRVQKDGIEMQAEAESLAFMLGENFLIQRVDNACHKLDEQIKALIRRKMKCDQASSDLTSTLVFQVRDQLTKANQPHLDQKMIDALKTHEQVMLGIKQSSDETETRRFLPALIEWSSQAQQLQKIMHNKKMTYTEKVEKVLAFQASFDKALVKFKQMHSVPEAFGLGKKATPLFFKPYTALSAPIVLETNRCTNPYTDFNHDLANESKFNL